MSAKAPASRKTHALSRRQSVARKLEAIAQRVRLMLVRNKDSRKPASASDLALKSELVRISKQIEAEAKLIEQSL